MLRDWKLESAIFTSQENDERMAQPRQARPLSESQGLNGLPL